MLQVFHYSNVSLNVELHACTYMSPFSFISIVHVLGIDTCGNVYDEHKNCGLYTQQSKSWSVNWKTVGHFHTPLARLTFVYRLYRLRELLKQGQHLSCTHTLTFSFYILHVQEDIDTDVVCLESPNSKREGVRRVQPPHVIFIYMYMYMYVLTMPGNHTSVR